MKKERKTVTLPRLQQNTGQIDWLPKNPRQWTQTDIDRTVKSIEEDTDFLEDRPLLAVENGDKLVVFAGNLRLTAVRKTDQNAVPVVVYSPESDEDQETIKRRALKDNGSFGAWDYDALANEWDVPFTDWGVPAFETETNVSEGDFGTDFTLPDGEKQPFRQVSFQLPNEMADVLLFAIEAGKCTKPFYEIEGDEEDKNANGVAIYVIAKSWLDQMAELLKPGEYEKMKKEVEGLRHYLRDALQKSGRKASEVDDLLGTSGMAGHYFGASQWMFPTRAAYEKMKEIMELPRDYSECKMVELRFRLFELLKK